MRRRQANSLADLFTPQASVEERKKISHKRRKVNKFLALLNLLPFY